MKFEEIKDFLDVTFGNYKDDESAIESKKTTERLDRQATNLYAFKKSYSHYQKILDTYAKLARDMGLKNSLEVCMLFTYLLWNGYFSVKGSHKYTNYKVADIEGLASFDVMNGKGVCISYSTLLRDFLIKCGYDSAILLNTLPEDIKLSYVPDVYRDYGRMRKFTSIEQFIRRTVTNKLGNHAMTLVNDNGNIYAYDATNLSYVYIRNINEARVVNGKGIFKLIPYISSAVNLPEESYRLLQKFYSTKEFNIPFPKSYFQDTFIKLIDFLNQNYDALNEYYDAAFDHISYVASTVESITKK